MKMTPLSSLKCFFVAWIFGWVFAIYVPSLLIAMTAPSPPATGSNLFAQVFAIADEVAPAAKLAFGVVFAGLLLVARLAFGQRAALVDMSLGIITMFFVIAFLPENSSRGFGIGLTGLRFDPMLTAIYLGSALLSGLVFTISEARCIVRTQGSKH